MKTASWLAGVLTFGLSASSTAEIFWHAEFSGYSRYGDGSFECIFTTTGRPLELSGPGKFAPGRVVQYDVETPDGIYVNPMGFFESSGEGLSWDGSKVVYSELRWSGSWEDPEFEENYASGTIELYTGYAFFTYMERMGPKMILNSSSYYEIWPLADQSLAIPEGNSAWVGVVLFMAPILMGYRWRR